MALRKLTDEEARRSRDRAAKKEILKNYDVPPEYRPWLEGDEVTAEAAASFARRFFEKRTSAPPWQSDGRSQFPRAAHPDGAEAHDLELMNQQMGMHALRVRMPYRKADGTFVLHTVRPSDLRAHLAAHGHPRPLAPPASADELPEREREEMQRQMGIQAPARMPERKADGTFVLHAVRPSDLRRMLASEPAPGQHMHAVRPPEPEPLNVRFGAPRTFGR